MKHTICASLLDADILNLEREISDLKRAGITRLHIDIMDGVFVENISMETRIIHRISDRFPDMKMDCHLMVQNPSLVVGMLDAEQVDCITVHIEAQDVLHAVDLIAKQQKKIGIAVSPDTDIWDCRDAISKADLVLIMTVYPGRGGQSFIKRCAEKIRAVKTINTKAAIQVDGGINAETIAYAVQADYVVVGSFLTKSADRTHALAALKDCLGRARKQAVFSSRNIS